MINSIRYSCGPAPCYENQLKRYLGDFPSLGYLDYLRGKQENKRSISKTYAFLTPSMRSPCPFNFITPSPWTTFTGIFDRFW